MSLLKEENGVYAIDDANAVWATNNMHEVYRVAKLEIKDIDFLLETHNNDIIAVEYKNSNISDAKKPESFNPGSDDKLVNDIYRKFYDAIPYLYLKGKQFPIEYVFIVEAPNGDQVMRMRLRNRIKSKLPFELQENMNTGRAIIKRFNVMSIEEWNKDEKYGQFPMILIKTNENG